MALAAGGGRSFLRRVPELAEAVATVPQYARGVTMTTMERVTRQTCAAGLLVRVDVLPAGSPALSRDPE